MSRVMIMKYKNILLFTLFTFAIPYLCFASKVRPGRTVISQIDGTTITATAHGDEHFHFYTATDGTILVMDGTSLFVAGQADDGKLISTGILAHNPESRDLTETLAANRQDRKAMLSKGEQLTAAARNRLSTRSSSSPNYFPSKGSPKTIVLLVEFSDLKFKISDPKAQFENFLNSMETNPHQQLYENYGSVRRYYSDMSFGQFTPQFDIYGP